jgi:MoxR-like ATPase
VLMPALGHRVFFTPIYELRRQEFSEALITQIMNRLAVP